MKEKRKEEIKQRLGNLVGVEKSISVTAEAIKILKRHRAMTVQTPEYSTSSASHSTLCYLRKKYK